MSNRVAPGCPRLPPVHREHDPIGCQGMVIRQGEARLIAIVLKPHRSPSDGYIEYGL